MKYLLLTLALITGVASAAEEVAPVDISKCTGFNCTTVWKGKYTLDQTIEVQAWFDAVDTSNAGTLSFFPLFSIKNDSGAPVKLKLGMQLLDKDNKVLAQASHEATFAPYHTGMSDQDRFVSINAVDLTKESTASAKSVKVTYEKIN